jgi:hypothetical protein
MSGLFGALPEIIKNASSSRLGIFALMLLIVAGLAYVFFRKSGERVRAAIFLCFFAGAALIGLAALGTTQPDQHIPNPSSEKIRSQENPASVAPQNQTALVKSPVLHEVTVVLRNSSEPPILLIDNRPGRLTSYAAGVGAVRVSSGSHEIQAEYPDYVCKALFSAPALDQVLANCQPK